jgi:hypothetical protein
MKGRKLLLALAAVTLVAVGVAGGVALGSSSDQPAKDTGQVPQPAAGKNVIKCKAQACAHWNTAGQLVGASKNVLGVVRMSTGHYCVQLAPKLTATSSTTALVSVDFNNGTPGLDQGLVVHTAATPCPTNGIAVYGYRHDSGSSTVEDTAGYLVVP